jgi:hypothetical protein
MKKTRKKKKKTVYRKIIALEHITQQTPHTHSRGRGTNFSKKKDPISKTIKNSNPSLHIKFLCVQENVSISRKCH